MTFSVDEEREGGGMFAESSFVDSWRDISSVSFHWLYQPRVAGLEFAVDKSFLLGQVLLPQII